MTSFRYFIRKKYSVIQPVAGFETTPEAFSDCARRLIESPGHCVLNCLGVPPLNESLIERLQFLDHQLKASNKKLRLLFPSEGFKAALVQSKTGRNLITADSLAAALDDFDAEDTDESNRQFIKAFVNATLRTFFVQARAESRRGSIFVKKEALAMPLGDISGVISVIGRNLFYGVFLSFPKETFLKLVKRILGENHTDINSENQDAAAEFLNIIFGQAKLALNLKGAGLKPQVPKIVVAGEFAGIEIKPGEFTTLTAGKTVVIPFDSEIGSFFIEVWFPLEFADSII